LPLPVTTTANSVTVWSRRARFAVASAVAPSTDETISTRVIAAALAAVPIAGSGSASASGTAVGSVTGDPAEVDFGIDLPVATRSPRAGGVHAAAPTESASAAGRATLRRQRMSDFNVRRFGVVSRRDPEY
jgi:hypothetical protein